MEVIIIAYPIILSGYKDKDNEVFTAQLSGGSWRNIHSTLSTDQMQNLHNAFKQHINTEELQTERFEKVEPVVADLLRHLHKSYYEGKYYSADWDSQSKNLTAWRNDEQHQPFLSAHWDRDSGWQDMSDSLIDFKIAHHFSEDIQPALEREKLCAKKIEPTLEQ